jgi:hypothetical protein
MVCKPQKALAQVIGGVIVLASVGSIMHQGSKVTALHASNAGPSVTIGAPLPLPTTAAQSGGWTVGITGTPGVTVTNPASSPVPTWAVDNPGLHPILLTQSANQSAFTFPLPNSGNIVIEQVMMRCFEASAAFAPTDFELEVFLNNLPASFYFVPSVLSLSGSVTELIVNQSTHIYATSGTSLIIGSEFPTPSGTHCDASLAGHFVNP